MQHPKVVPGLGTIGVEVCGQFITEQRTLRLAVLGTGDTQVIERISVTRHKRKGTLVACNACKGKHALNE
jgi:hypothetical protein